MFRPRPMSPKSRPSGLPVVPLGSRHLDYEPRSETERTRWFAWHRDNVKEMLIALAIILVLLAITVPLVRRIRYEARQAQQQQLRQQLQQQRQQQRVDAATPAVGEAP